MRGEFGRLESLKMSVSIVEGWKGFVTRKGLEEGLEEGSRKVPHARKVVPR